MAFDLHSAALMKKRKIISRTSQLVLLACPIAIALAGCGSDAQPAAGGAAQIGFSGASGSNVALSHIPASAVFVAGRDDSTGGLSVGVTGDQPEGGGSSRKEWQLIVGFVGAPQTGRVYALKENSGDDGTGAIDFQESPAAGGFRDWISVAGSLTVKEIVGTKLTVDFDKVPMQPSTGGSGNEATGTFELSGSITIDDVTAAPPR